MDVIDLNFGAGELDKIKLISAGANYSVCYSESGILYFWGMLVPDDYEQVEYFPKFLNISIPENEYRDDLDQFDNTGDVLTNNGGAGDNCGMLLMFDFHLTHIASTFREILACDSTGRVFCCTVNESQTLRPYPSEKQKKIGSVHKVLVGRSAHIFVDQLLCLERCKVEIFNEDKEDEEEKKDEIDEKVNLRSLPPLIENKPIKLETLISNRICVRLCDLSGHNYYLNSTTSANTYDQEESKQNN